MHSVLSFHALLVAAIFVSYIALMIGFGVYIWHTGRHEDREPPGEITREQEDEPGQDPDAELAVAA